MSLHVLFMPSWYPTPNNPVRGSFFRDQALALQRAGHKLGVVTCTLNTSGVRRLERHRDSGIDTLHEHVPALPITIHLETLTRKTKSILRLYRRYESICGKPDIIHVQSAVSSGPAALLISQSRDIPYVITEHASAYARGEMPSMNLALIKRVFTQASGVASVSRSLGQDLSRRLEIDSKAIDWIPNMVSPDFRPGPRLHSHCFKFLTVGSLVENKGHKDLITAFAKAFGDQADIELEIVGRGPLRSELMSLAKKVGAGDRVSFSGGLVRTEVVSRMQACDAFVLSSHYETFGVALVEALACGKPCVATSCGGPELMIDHSNGSLVPPQDLPALAMAMSDMVDQIENYDVAAIANNCVSKFGADRLVKRLESFYEAAIDKRIPS